MISIKKVDQDGTSNLKNYIYGAYSFGVVAFGFLIPYMITTLNLLRPSKMIDMLAKEVTKEKILSFLENNPHEGYNIQSYGNRDKDPILPIIDIVHSSLRNYDTVTATQGLHAIGHQTNNIFEKDDFKDKENEDITSYIIEHLHTVVKHAEKEENDYILLEVIKGLYKNGFTAANKKQENATMLAMNELSEILDIVDKKKFKDLLVLAASFYYIEVSAAKNGLRDVLEGLKNPLNKLLSIEQNKGDKGNKSVIDLVEKAIENMKTNLID